MELNISEIDDESVQFEEIYSNETDFIENNYLHNVSPEDNYPVKRVHFEVPETAPLRPMKQSIPRTQARVTRPYVPPPKPQLSYDDILAKMGMFVADGKLHLMDENPQSKKQIQKQIQKQTQKQVPQQTQVKPSYEENIPQNSYIYNKYFKDHVQEQVSNRPLTPQQYKDMLVKTIIQKYKIKQMKSTKLIMPVSNINVAYGNANLNKLFNFSKR